MRLPLALTACTCFSWRNTLEALLRGGHAYTRNEKRSHSDTRFMECFHSSEVPCLFPSVKGKGGARSGGSRPRSPGAQEVAVQMRLSCCCLAGGAPPRKAAARDPGSLSRRASLHPPKGSLGISNIFRLNGLERMIIKMYFKANESLS